MSTHKNIYGAHHSPIVEELSKNKHDAKYKLNAVTSSPTGFCSNDNKVDVSIKINFDIQKTKALVLRRYFIVGEGGSVPGFGQRKGKSFTATLNLDQATDRFSDVQFICHDGCSGTIPNHLAYHSGSGTSKIKFYHLFENVTFRGLYYNNGRLEFKAKLVVKDSPGKEIGKMNLAIPIQYGWQDFWGSHFAKLGDLKAELTYLRLPESNFKRPHIYIRSNDQYLIPEEKNAISLEVKNISEIVLDNLQMNLHKESIDSLLAPVNDAELSQTHSQLKSAETVKKMFSLFARKKDCLGDEESKSVTPKFTLSYDVVPKGSEQKTTFYESILAQPITVYELKQISIKTDTIPGTMTIEDKCQLNVTVTNNSTYKVNDIELSLISESLRDSNLDKAVLIPRIKTLKFEKIELKPTEQLTAIFDCYIDKKVKKYLHDNNDPNTSIRLMPEGKIKYAMQLSEIERQEKELPISFPEIQIMLGYQLSEPQVEFSVSRSNIYPGESTEIIIEVTNKSSVRFESLQVQVDKKSIGAILEPFEKIYEQTIKDIESERHIHFKFPMSGREIGTSIPKFKINYLYAPPVFIPEGEIIAELP